MNISNVLKPTNPAMIDKPIAELQDSLKAKLSWLDYSFGRSQRLVKSENGKNVFYPGVHHTGTNYLSMLPNEDFGNFTFWDVDDPEDLIGLPGMKYDHYEFKVALILWVNLDKIYNNSTQRNTEALKEAVLAAINQTYITTGRIEPQAMFKKAENIYKGYNINEIKSQFLMQPFYGLRIECLLKMYPSC